MLTLGSADHLITHERARNFARTASAAVIKILYRDAPFAERSFDSMSRCNGDQICLQTALQVLA